MAYDLAGRTVVLTGAASGIGAALARALAAKGARLILVDRSRGALDAIAEELAPSVSSAHAFDIRDRKAVAALPARIMHGNEVHHIDILINNAGIAAMGRFDETSLDEFDAVMAINFGGVLTMTKAFLPHLADRARIVNLSSLFGLIGPPGQVPYATSKFAVRGFSEALRNELAETGIKVVSVHPGGIRTAIARNAVIASNVAPESAREATAAFGKFLRMSPERAAEKILRAVQQGRPRLLIGGDARLGDILARIAPAHYGALLRRTMGGMRRHVGTMPRGSAAT